MEQIKAAEFDAVVADNKAVVVDFFATWCQPCKMLGKLFESLEPTYGDKIKFVKVDIDQDPELAQRFGVMSVPTVLFYKDAEKVSEMVGFKGKPAVEAALQGLIGE